MNSQKIIFEIKKNLTWIILFNIIHKNSLLSLKISPSNIKINKKKSKQNNYLIKAIETWKHTRWIWQNLSNFRGWFSPLNIINSIYLILFYFIKCCVIKWWNISFRYIVKVTFIIFICWLFIFQLHWFIYKVISLFLIK